jgi:hypothetical protein
VAAQSGARRRLRREEGDNLPCGPAGPGDGMEAGWRREPTGRTNGPEVKENSFPNKNLIFDYSKALEICRRRFRRNFEEVIFLNSSRLLQDFRKI